MQQDSIEYWQSKYEILFEFASWTTLGISSKKLRFHTVQTHFLFTLSANNKFDIESVTMRQWWVRRYPFYSACPCLNPPILPYFPFHQELPGIKREVRHGYRMKWLWYKPSQYSILWSLVASVFSMIFSNKRVWLVATRQFRNGCEFLCYGKSWQ